MDVPYGAGFAGLCVLQGVLVCAAWRRSRRPRPGRRAMWIGLAVPLGVFLLGLAATRGSDWSVEALSDLATFGTPVAAALAGWAWGWRLPWAYPAAAAVAWIVAWRADGLPADIAAVALVAGACLTFASLIASFTPPPALAAGLVVLAIVDAILVFGDQIRPGSQALHAIVPPEAGGRPLPALQDATLDRARFGWFDILAPALVATLLAGWTRPRLIAGGLTALAALALGLLLAVTDQVPGTVPPLVGVAVWALTAPAPFGTRPGRSGPVRGAGAAD